MNPVELIHTNSKGQGVAVLFHGMTGGSDEMQELAQYLHKKGYNVFIPELSGHEDVYNLKITKSSEWLNDAELAFKKYKPSVDEKFVIIGLSFGGLLALYLASKYSEEIDSLVVCSPAYIFRSKLRRYLLYLLSFLPDWILDRLWLVKKQARKKGVFSKERKAFKRHSIAAGARLLQVRRLVGKSLSKVICDTLILHDPEEHLINPLVPSILKQKIAAKNLSVELLPGAEHEMTMGPRYQEVNEKIFKFI